MFYFSGSTGSIKIFCYYRKIWTVKIISSRKICEEKKNILQNILLNAKFSRIDDLANILELPNVFIKAFDLKGVLRQNIEHFPKSPHRKN